MPETKYSDIFIVEADGEEVDKWPTAHRDKLLKSVKNLARVHDCVRVYRPAIVSEEPDIRLGFGEWRRGRVEYDHYQGVVDVVLIDGEIRFDSINLFNGERFVDDEIKVNGTPLNDNQIKLIRLMLDLFDNDYDETRFTNEEVEEMVYKIKRLFIMK